MMSRHATHAADPRHDCEQIARYLGMFAFPWDTTRSPELALFRTFASPRIGGLLHSSGEFEARTQKRYDDTDLTSARSSSTASAANAAGVRSRE